MLTSLTHRLFNSRFWNAKGRLATVAPYVVALFVMALTVTADLPGLRLRESGGCLAARQAVGGVMINTDGILATGTLDDSRRMREAMLEAYRSLQGQQDNDLKRPTQLRKISLRAMQEAVLANVKSGQPIPEEIQYMAGLQSVRHVFVYPEQNDIVLAGFGEGWKLHEKGFVVGATTGRAVLELDDFLAAFRSVASGKPISCSIDPTADGINKLQQFTKQLGTVRGNSPQLMANIEQQLGMQKISFGQGVDVTSHLARVLIAADYRMKRIAMALEPSPVAGLPSYMSMISAGSRGVSNMMPRWWLTTDYDPLLHDADKLAWELTGRGIKAMSEEDLRSADGTIQRGARTGGPTQRWADMLTAKYAELSVKEPIFGQLRGVVDLTVVAALIQHESLATRAGLDLSPLVQSVSHEPHPVASQTPSIASALMKGTNLVISASGGVEISPGKIIERQTEDAKVAPLRSEAAPQANAKRWWWN